MLLHRFLNIPVSQLLSSLCNRWGNWVKQSVSRFFKITKLEIISCNLRAEAMFFHTLPSAKATSRPRKDPYFPCVMLWKYLFKAEACKNNTLLACLHMVTLWPWNSQRICGKQPHTLPWRVCFPHLAFRGRGCQPPPLVSQQGPGPTSLLFDLGCFPTRTFLVFTSVHAFYWKQWQNLPRKQLLLHFLTEPPLSLPLYSLFPI